MRKKNLGQYNYIKKLMAMANKKINAHDIIYIKKKMLVNFIKKYPLNILKKS